MPVLCMWARSNREVKASGDVAQAGLDRVAGPNRPVARQELQSLLPMPRLRSRGGGQHRAVVDVQFEPEGDGVQGTVGGSVPATLSLTLGAPASFGAFTPGVEKTYEASTTANVISLPKGVTRSCSYSVLPAGGSL